MRFDQTGSQIILWCIFTRAGDNNDDYDIMSDKYSGFQSGWAHPKR